MSQRTRNVILIEKDEHIIIRQYYVTLQELNLFNRHSVTSMYSTMIITNAKLLLNLSFILHYRG